jgi:hypothetical protein
MRLQSPENSHLPEVATNIYLAGFFAQCPQQDFLCGVDDFALLSVDALLAAYPRLSPTTIVAVNRAIIFLFIFLSPPSN